MNFEEQKSLLAKVSYLEDTVKRLTSQVQRLESRLPRQVSLKRRAPEWEKLSRVSPYRGGDPL